MRRFVSKLFFISFAATTLFNCASKNTPYKPRVLTSFEIAYNKAVTAVENGDLVEVKKLSEGEPDILTKKTLDSSNLSHNTLAHVAAEQSQLEILKYIVTKNVLLLNEFSYIQTADSSGDKIVYGRSSCRTVADVAKLQVAKIGRQKPLSDVKKAAADAVLNFLTKEHSAVLKLVKPTDCPEIEFSSPAGG